MIQPRPIISPPARLAPASGGADCAMTAVRLVDDRPRRRGGRGQLRRLQQPAPSTLHVRIARLLRELHAGTSA